ncbi:acyl-CoA thioesterase [Sphingomonas sp. ZT3P38]|uniref:acyl-CoA thioesterase n=1 Tax=Parasphingomonas zepuensis TaxID=3096161 RepID=UPI002FC91DDD
MPHETMPQEQPAVRVTAVPADANVYGDIFGGWLMSQMDLGASSVASRHAGGRAVTVAVEGMAFHRPVFIGDEVSVFARLIKVGRTSMSVEVEAWARDRHSDAANKVTQAVFAFVAVGQDRRPRAVRGLVA